MSVEAFPLAWPTGRPRTVAHERTWSRFKATFDRARRKCLNEVALLGATLPVLSTNVPLRKDGTPYSQRGQMEDPGVALYFTYNDRQMCFACDRWAKIEDNMHAIALTIGALRGIERWGSGDMMAAAFSGFTALPAPGQTTARGWREVLEISPECNDLQQVRSAYRTLSSVCHPDRPGGSHDAMSELNWAWAQAQEALRAPRA